MLRRQVWGLPIYVLGAVASAAVLVIWSTPWIEGKAFATAAPAIPFAAVVAAGLLLARGRVVEGAVLGAVVAGGVLWSNVLQYHDVWLGPREQLAELSSRSASASPATGRRSMTEYQPYGVRHFLRKLDAEGASELRVRPVLAARRAQLDKGAYANIDEFAEADLRVYRTLVLRRSPDRQPPPVRLPARLERRWYDVWQRPTRRRRPVAEHLPLGDGASPAPSRTARRSSGWRASRGRTAGSPQSCVPRRSSCPRTARWTTSGGRAVGGRYGIWLGGSFRDGLETPVDGGRSAAVATSSTTRASTRCSARQSSRPAGTS